MQASGLRGKGRSCLSPSSMPMGLTCKICFESASCLTAGAPPQPMHARITPCGHVFCHPCAAAWFRTDAACPVCRRPVDGLPSLISLYDHDAGLQSSSFDVFHNNIEVNCNARSLEMEHTNLGRCIDSNGSDELGEGNEEELHVRYVLGKVTERWQEVMVERAKLKIQVARLEKTKEELLSQLQRLGEENTALKQLLSEGFHETAYRRTHDHLEELEKKHSAKETSYYPDTSHYCEVSSSPSGHHTESYCSKMKGLLLRPAANVLDMVGANSLNPSEKVIERMGTNKWELVHTVATHSGPVHGIAVNPSGDLVATASWDHLCKIYDRNLEKEVAVLNGHELGLYAVKFSPSKRNIVATVSSDHTCRIWNADTAKCLRVLEGHTDEVNGLSFKIGTHLLATASDDMVCKIWDAERGLCITTLEGHHRCVYGVCFQHQGHLLATSSFDLTAKLWDPRSTKNVCTFRGHSEEVIGIDIDSSGFLLATGSDDKTCRIWDLRIGHCLEVLDEHRGEVKRVAFSPFNRLLATTSGDTTSRLYDASTFECLHVLSSHSDHVFDVAWSPTADFIVTASHDHLWKLWQPRISSFCYSISSDFR